MSLSPGLRYAALFICILLPIASFMANRAQIFFDLSRNITINTTTFLGGLLGLSISSNADLLTVNGFSMRIINQCTALHYVVILALAMLLYTRHTLKYRLTGITIATIVVLIANSIRLLVTGISGTVSMDVFEVVHEYIWVGLFALLVFGIWKIWADGKLQLNGRSAWLMAQVVMSCTLVFLVLIVFKNYHCRLLASLATPMFKLLVGDSQAYVFWDGNLHFTQGKATVQMGMFFEIANIAVYIGLMLPYLWRNRKMIMYALLGLVALVVLYAEFIAYMGMNFIRHGVAAAEAYQFIGSSMFLALPMLTYWLVVNCNTGENAQTPDSDLQAGVPLKPRKMRHPFVHEHKTMKPKV